MKKTLSLLAVVLFISSLSFSSSKVNEWPSPSCPTGNCVPGPGGGH